MSDEYGYEYYDDDERADELADLQARIAALSDPSTDPGATEPAAPPPTPAPPVDDSEWIAAINAAGSAQEVEMLMAKRAALVDPAPDTGAASDAWADVRGSSRANAWKQPAAPPTPVAATKEGLDACRTPEEVMAFLRNAGVSTNDPVAW